MEKKHLRRIQEKFSDIIRNKRIIVLDIPDDYKYMDEELVEILKARVSEYID